MSARAVRILGALLLLAHLSVLLATDDIGLGSRDPGVAVAPGGSPVTDENGAPKLPGELVYRWPYVLEDWYDRSAYQQRGRWLPTGTTPYLDEHSDIPQLATWQMGLPYLFFDHGIEPGAPFETLDRSRVVLLEAGLSEELVDGSYRRFIELPYHPAGLRPETAGPLEPLLARIRALTLGRAEFGRIALARAWQAGAGSGEDASSDASAEGQPVPDGRTIFARARVVLVQAGLTDSETDLALRRLAALPYDASAFESDPDHPARQVTARLDAIAAERYERATIAVDAAWRAQAGRTADMRRNRVGYGNGYQVLMLFWYLVTFFCCIELLRIAGRPPAWALLLLLPGSLYFMFNRSDPPMIGMLAVAFLLQFRGLRLWAAAALGAAMMVKWAPLALVPLFLSHNFHSALDRERLAGRTPRYVALFLRQAVLPASVILGLVLGIWAITWFWDDGGWEAVWYVMDWHLHTRQPNHASLLSLLTHPARLGWLEMADRDWLSKLCLVMQFGPAFALAALAPIRSRDSLARVAVMALLGVATFSKFFSPQWVTWTGFLCVFLAHRQRTYALLFALANLTAYIQLPLLWYPFRRGENADLFWGWSYWRVVLLVCFWGFALFDFMRRVRTDRDPPDAESVPRRASPGRASTGGGPGQERIPRAGSVP